MNLIRSSFLAAIMLIFYGIVNAEQIQPVQTAPSSPVNSITVNTILQPSQSGIEGQQPMMPKELQTQQPQTPGTEAPAPVIQPAQTVQPPAEEVSEFEEFIAGRLPMNVSTSLRKFGYSLFRRPPSTFAPVEKVPVGPEYIIGPGDEIRITLWGKIDGSWNFFVDRDGNINLPKIGVLGVTGLTFNEIKNLLYKEFSKYYTGFEMNVSMGSLRTIRVFIVGYAQRPGAYTISSLSTLINALFEAGGPSKSGTMRNIKVLRNNREICNFDMYEFLMNGDKSRDIRLMPEDVIFIPPSGAVAGIAGNVMNPAIYEMNRETRLLDMISMSGGLTNIAFKGRIQVWRIEDRQYRSIFEGDLIEIDKNSSKNFMLKDGDLIKIYPIFEVKNIIFLSGAVASPGEFAVKPGVTKIQDVINQSGGLLYFASNQAEITRVKVTQEGPQTERIMIDVSKALTGDPKHNIQLESNDYIFIRTVPDWELFQKVSIHGEVRHPGTYTIKKGEKLSSLIKRAGGFSDKAYLRGAKFFRESVRSIQQKQTDEMADRLEREVIGLGTTEVAVALSPEEAQIKEYELKQKREFVKHIKSMRATGRLVLKIDQPDILSKTPFDLELEEGDSLFIPTNPGSVQVIGSVYNQSAFIFDANQGVSSYVEMTGGATQYADTDKIFVLKVDGTAIKPGGGLFSLAWSRNTRQWESGSRELEPGDTIVVPEKLEKTPWMRDIKDITQILYQIAVGVGVMFVAF